jgi:hypothetical protein
MIISAKPSIVNSLGLPILIGPVTSVGVFIRRTIVNIAERARLAPIAISVHQMVLTLERARFIRRQPGVARSIEVIVDPKLLPELL